MWVCGPVRLDILSGPLGGTQVEAVTQLTVGRGPGNTLLLDDLKVSRHHATLVADHGHLIVVDAGSTNGTWVNDERVVERRTLRDGDRLRIGGSEMRVVASPAASPASQHPTVIADAPWRGTAVTSGPGFPADGGG
jgi:pSer/pThr/pTyr-binding forkhead associated (FHA) protein